MARNLIIFIIFSILSGCASVRDKYPDFDESIAGKKQVEVVVDGVFLSHLKGKTLGFNVEKNKEILRLISKATEESFKLNGFDPTIRYAGHGLTHEKKPDIEYVVSEGWKPTENKLNFPLDTKAESPWASKETEEYLRDLLSLARAESALRTKDKSLRTKTFNAKGDSNYHEIPPIIKNLPSDFLVYVKAERTIRSLSEKVGRNLLTAAVSGALTGGSLILTTNGDFYTLDVFALEIETGDILWHQQQKREGFKNVTQSIKEVFASYPLVEGRYLKIRERKNRRLDRRHKRKTTQTQ